MPLADVDRRFTYRNSKGGLSINSIATLAEVLSQRPLNGSRNFTKLLDRCAELVRAEYPEVTAGAFANSRGRWYEWMLSLGSESYFQDNSPQYRMIPLPNISSFDCSKLYVSEIYDVIKDLRSKVKIAGDVNLVTSNPDFVIVKSAIFNKSVDGDWKTKIEIIDNMHQDLEGKCYLDDIAGYGAAKLSVRSDRRYQIPHEGSLFKALYRHIQTREWILDAPGIKYFALAGEFGDQDIEALKTVATHSIVDVGSLPQKAVDNAFVVNTEKSLRTALTEMLA